MILHLSPETPALIRGAASLALVLHISGAATALLAGPAAMMARKGGRLHRVSGNVFFVAMLAMSSVGAIVSPMLNDPISGLAGAFAFYLTATGWAAVIRPEGRTGAFERGALVLVMALALIGLALGYAGATSPNGVLGGQPYQIPCAFAAMAVIAALCDASALRRGGVHGSARIGRHLWRMGVALFITAGSFAGQPRAQPEALRGSPLLFIPALIILAATIWWLARTRLRRAGRPVRAQHVPA